MTSTTPPALVIAFLHEHRSFQALSGSGPRVSEWVTVAYHTLFDTLLTSHRWHSASEVELPLPTLGLGLGLRLGLGLGLVLGLGLGLGLGQLG